MSSLLPVRHHGEFREELQMVSVPPHLLPHLGVHQHLKMDSDKCSHKGSFCQDLEMASRKWNLLESRKINRTLASEVLEGKGVGGIFQVKEK